eukprot:355459-Pleurochrysis_carterae.AAC.1
MSRKESAIITRLSGSQGSLSREKQNACKERVANTEGRRLESNTGGGESHSCASPLSPQVSLTSKGVQSGRSKNK